MDINLVLPLYLEYCPFSSPCVLPLVPGYLSIFSLQGKSRYDKVVGSLQFILGFSLVFISLAAITTTVGSFLLKKTQAHYLKISGVIIITFGLNY